MRVRVRSRVNTRVNTDTKNVTSKGLGTTTICTGGTNLQVGPSSRRCYSSSTFHLTCIQQTRHLVLTKKHHVFLVGESLLQRYQPVPQRRSDGIRFNVRVSCDAPARTKNKNEG